MLGVLAHGAAKAGREGRIGPLLAARGEGEAGAQQMYIGRQGLYGGHGMLAGSD